MTARLLRAANNAVRYDLDGPASPKRLRQEGKDNGLDKYGHVEDFEKIVEDIQEDHINAACTSLKSAAVRDELCEDIRRECEDLQGTLEAVRRFKGHSSRSLDTIISKGEILSSKFMTALLRDRGIDAVMVDLSIVYDDTVGHDATAPDSAFYHRMIRAIAQEIRSVGNKVPVLTGYFGVVPGGLLKEIGRGYTDLAAALVSVGLGVQEMQIWKEVDGIFTADPRKVPTAQLLPTISPSEAAELTNWGSEVIHAFTMKQAIQARIPIRIKNVMDPNSQGTAIMPDPESPSTLPGRRSNLLPDLSAKLPHGNVTPGPKRPTAITAKRGMLVLEIEPDKGSVNPQFMLTMFTILAKWNLKVDIISVSELLVSLALHSQSSMVGGVTKEETSITNHDIREAIAELERLGHVSKEFDLAAISLIDKDMKSKVGVASKMITALAENNINIVMLSQGVRENKIICVIEDRVSRDPLAQGMVMANDEIQHADRALTIIHTALFIFWD